jgi:hypothetical protein
MSSHVRGHLIWAIHCGTRTMRNTRRNINLVGVFPRILCPFSGSGSVSGSDSIRSNMDEFPIFYNCELFEILICPIFKTDPDPDPDVFQAVVMESDDSTPERASGSHGHGPWIYEH